MSRIELELALRVCDTHHQRLVRIAYLLDLKHKVTHRTVMENFRVSAATAKRDLSRVRTALREHREDNGGAK